MKTQFCFLTFLFLWTLSSLSICDELQDSYDPNREVVAELLRKYPSYKEKDVLEHYDDCNDSVYKWQVICVNYIYVKSDLILNKTYKNLLEKLKGTSAEEKLKLAQRAWISFRDLSCSFENDSYESSRLSYLTESSCASGYADERSKKLKEYLECSDTGCPGFQ